LGLYGHEILGKNPQEDEYGRGNRCQAEGETGNQGEGAAAKSYLPTEAIWSWVILQGISHIYRDIIISYLCVDCNRVLAVVQRVSRG